MLLCSACHLPCAPFGGRGGGGAWRGEDEMRDNGPSHRVRKDCKRVVFYHQTPTMRMALRSLVRGIST